MHFRLTHALAAALASTLSIAEAQLKTDVASATFTAGIEGPYQDLPDLAQKMVENTRLDVIVDRAEPIILVAGVLDRNGNVLYGALSEPIIANPGRNPLIEVGAGRLVNPWQGFDDPLLGFDDPLLGFDDPLLRFDDPLLGFDDPLLGLVDPAFRFDDRSFGFEALGEAIDAIWGTNGTAYAPESTPDFIWGTGGAAAEDPVQVLDAIWDTNGASYEGPADSFLVLAPLSLDAETEVRFSAAVLPFSRGTP